MTAIVPASSSPADAATVPTDRAKLRQVAQQFEALLLRQMLSEARKADFGDTLFSDESLGTFREMMDSRFADIAAQTGTLGLGKMIEAQVARMLPAKT